MLLMLKSDNLLHVWGNTSSSCWIWFPLMFRELSPEANPSLGNALPSSILRSHVDLQKDHS